MPGLNGTGPMGQGSRTGRGLGNCVNNAAGTPAENVNVNPNAAPNAAAPVGFFSRWGCRCGQFLQRRGRFVEGGRDMGRGLGLGPGRGFRGGR